MALDRGGTMFRTKNSDLLTTERANETTRAGDSPSKYKANSGMKDGPFRNTIVDQGSIHSSELQSHHYHQ